MTRQIWTSTTSPATGVNHRTVQRLVNVSPQPIDELSRLALEDGIGTFILIGDDEAAIRTLAEEVAPAVREQVASELSRRG